MSKYLTLNVLLSDYDCDANVKDSEKRGIDENLFLKSLNQPEGEFRKKSSKS